MSNESVNTYFTIVLPTVFASCMAINALVVSILTLRVLKKKNIPTPEMLAPFFLFTGVTIYFIGQELDMTRLSIIAEALSMLPLGILVGFAIFKTKFRITLRKVIEPTS